MRPLGAHLVGSVPLQDSRTVFRTVSTALGPHLRRLPDGETGVRTNWIAWQYDVLARTPGLSPVPVGDRGYLRRQLVQLDAGRAPPRFGPLGYADAALQSYAVFRALQREGVIPEAIRFQVSLPTPLAPVVVFVTEADRPVVEAPYAAQLFEELHGILAQIPHERLAIQWDLAVEVGLLENVWPAPFPDLQAGMVQRLSRLADAVPREVSLGYHLCYGDFGHKHFVAPLDAGALVRLANLVASFARPPDFLHLPVPLSWVAPSAYAPLSELALPAGLDLFLGLVHLTDGVDGGRRRISLASAQVPAFGIATECGWGRRPPQTIPALLDLHASLLEG